MQFAVTAVHSCSKLSSAVTQPSAAQSLAFAVVLGRLLCPTYSQPRCRLPASSLAIGHLQTNIRGINNQFAMTSVGAKDVSPSGHGPPTYIISGQLSHRVGHLLPDSDGGVQPRPVFAQLYFHDVQNELANRMVSVADGVAVGVVDLLQRLFHYINPYVRIFRTAGERLQEQPSRNLQIGFKRVGRAERGTHAAPISDDVAGILVCPDGGIDHAGLDIVLEWRPLLESGFSPLECVWHLDPCSMALQYPLLTHGVILGGPQACRVPQEVIMVLMLKMVMMVTGRNILMMPKSLGHGRMR